MGSRRASRPKTAKASRAPTHSRPSATRSARLPRAPEVDVKDGARADAARLARELSSRFARLAKLGRAVAALDAAIAAVNQSGDIEATCHLMNAAFWNDGRANFEAANEFGRSLRVHVERKWHSERSGPGVESLPLKRALQLVAVANVDHNQELLLIEGEIRRVFGLSSEDARRAIGHSNLRVPSQRWRERVRAVADFEKSRAPHPEEARAPARPRRRK